MRAAPWMLCLALTLAPTFGPVAAQDEPSEPLTEAEPGVWDQIRALYEQAKQAGEDVPADVYDWFKQDLSSIGDWEYRVVVVAASEASELEGRMNALGAERWECFAATYDAKRHHLFFRRKVRSYLGSIPVKDLWKLVPGGGPDGD